jgi:hypothetical protein
MDWGAWYDIAGYRKPMNDSTAPPGPPVLNASARFAGQVHKGSSMAASSQQIGLDMTIEELEYEYEQARQAHALNRANLDEVAPLESQLPRRERRGS